MKITLLALALAATPGVAQDTPPSPPPGGGSGMMMRADADNDGVITREEALRQAAERFDRMDANHDGKLTADELPRFGRRMRGGDAPLTPAPRP